MPLDPLFYAVRGDLADVRLAQQVFAPHYAAPMPWVIAAPTPLREAREADSATLVELEPGDLFEVLELTDETAWGTAPGKSRVGYVDRQVLTRIAG